MRNSFFRQKALENYKQSQIPKIMPKFTSPFITLLYWILSILFTGAMLAVATYNIPRLQQGSGIIRNVPLSTLRSYGMSVNGQGVQAIAILFLSDQLKSQLHTGTVAQVQVEGTQSLISGTIEHIDGALLTPDVARQRYSLSNQVVSHIPQPAFVALVGLGSVRINSPYDGRSVKAHLQVGMYNVLSLFFTTQAQ